jgi:hypothetical protein
MSEPRKIVLHSLRGYRSELDGLVRGWIESGITFVGVVGQDAAQLEDVIDELCLGDGSSPYFMLTSSHPDESLQDAIEFAEPLSGEFSGPVRVVEF